MRSSSAILPAEPQPSTIAVTKPANVIVFLASDLASFVTSSVWGVDGGSIRSIV
jgi:hypothetical protein